MFDADSPEPAFELDNPRLRFFLEHREQLREWIVIADEVAEAVANVLRSLGADLSARLSSPDIIVSHGLFGEARYGPVIHRPSWVAGEPPLPFVGVELGWDGRRVDPVGGWPGTQRPYVGVNTSHFLDEGRRVDAVLRAAMKANKEARRGYQAGSYWAVFKPLQARTDWWKDVAAWRDETIDELVACWSTWDPVIAGAVEESRLTKQNSESGSRYASIG